MIHHVDHVIRRNHVGWPVVQTVNSFTYSLIIYRRSRPSASGLDPEAVHLTATDRVGVRYWVGLRRWEP